MTFQFLESERANPFLYVRAILCAYNTKYVQIFQLKFFKKNVTVLPIQLYHVSKTLSKPTQLYVNQELKIGARVGENQIFHFPDFCKIGGVFVKSKWWSRNVDEIMRNCKCFGNQRNPLSWVNRTRCWSWRTKHDWWIQLAREREYKSLNPSTLICIFHSARPSSIIHYHCLEVPGSSTLTHLLQNLNFLASSCYHR